MALLWTMSHFPNHWCVALVQPPRIVYIHNTTMSHHVRLDSNRLHVWSLIQPPRIRCTTTTTFPYDHSNVWNPQYLSQQRSRLFSFVAAVPSSIWHCRRHRRRLSLPWHGYGVHDEPGDRSRHGIRTQRRSPLPYLYPNVTSLSSTTVVDPTPERMFTTTTTTTTATTTSKNHHTSHDDDDDHHDSNSRMVPMSDGQPTPDAADVVMDPKDTMVVPSSSSSSSTTTTNAAVVAATIKHEEQQQQPILGTVSKDDVHKEEVKHKRLSEVKFVFFIVRVGWIRCSDIYTIETDGCSKSVIVDSYSFLCFFSFSALCARALSLSLALYISL
jgi:hypothetical protein